MCRRRVIDQSFGLASSNLVCFNLMSEQRRETFWIFQAEHNTNNTNTYITVKNVTEKACRFFLLESPESTNKISIFVFGARYVYQSHIIIATDLEFNRFKIEPIFWLIYVSFSNVLFYCCKCFCETFCRAELM